MNDSKQKHLELNDRVLIQDLLDRGYANLTTIAKTLGRDVSTISKEIKKRRLKCKVDSSWITKLCVKKGTCNKTHVCENCVYEKPTKSCSHCVHCENNCDEYDEFCTKLYKPPYVCNGCSKLSTCKFIKYKYSAKEAQQQYETTLSESRSLKALEKEDTYLVDEIISNGVLKGQSIYHIAKANENKINVCERTIYNWVNNGITSIKRAHLPRASRRRPKKEYKYVNPKGKNILDGRTYIDYTNFSPNIPYEVLQLDTIIGTQNGKAIVTMQFVSTKLILAFLIPSKTANNVSSVFYTIRKALINIGLRQHDLMPVILTDNGTEFSQPEKIEIDEEGYSQSKVFYCNPYASYQKAEIENNHINLRRILEKGSSFDGLTQKQVTYACSQVNSMIRKTLGGKTAYDFFCYFHENGKQILDELGIERIDSKEVILKPRVLNLKD